MGETIEIRVKSSLYGVTDCVIDIETFEKGRRIFPCGDGCDHKLNSIEEELIIETIKDYKSK